MNPTTGKRKFTLLRYPGGKYYAIGLLEKFWRNIDHDEYREPFAGGCTVFFNKPKVAFNWLNDIDAELITTLKVIQDPEMAQVLCERTNGEVASKERWRQVKDYQPASDLDIAFKYFYLNRTSFSGKLVSSAWGYRPKRSLPPERWHEKILPASKLLSGVKLTGLDFRNVLTAKPQGSSVLMYVDPPYYNPPRNKHYRNGFNVEDHHSLSELLNETDYKFILTYDDVPEIRDLYKWANIYELSFFYRVGDSQSSEGARKLGFELVITNYKIDLQMYLFSPEKDN